MITLTAPADGALGAAAAEFLDVSIPWWLAVLLFGLAFAIGHATGRVETRIRRAERAAQPVPTGRTPPLTDEEFAAWSQRLDDAFRATQAGTWVPARLPEKRAVCGQPTSTSLGAVRCLARPGHPGQC